MPKIAIVYDRVNTHYGGAEAVVAALMKKFPQTDLITSIYNPKKALWAKDFKVKTSFLQRIPIIRNWHRLLATFMPFAFESLDLSEYDIIISITSAEAKGVITRKDQLHLCYLLTPPRYLYSFYDQYFKKNLIIRLPIIKSLAKLTLKYLKNWDQIAIHRPDVIIPISKLIAKRVEKFYQIKTETVLYPPVNINQLDEKIENFEKNDDYYLVVSRLVSYKNIEIAIRAAIELEKKLIIVGEGPQEIKLKSLASLLEKKAKLKNGSLIIFKKDLNSSSLAKIYKNAKALLMPGIDDFGITALEANLYGKPVIINKNSGAAEIIEDKKTGILLNYQEKDSEEKMLEELLKAIKESKKIKFDPQILSKNALKYDTNSFVTKFEKLLNKFYDQKVKGKL